MKGKIVLIPFPFTNLTITKLRPALALLESEKDVVVAFITHTGKPFKLFILQPSRKQFSIRKETRNPQTSKWAKLTILRTSERLHV